MWRTHSCVPCRHSWRHSSPKSVHTSVNAARMSACATRNAILEALMTQALVLFDIDGTLLRRAGEHHRQALVDAVRKVTGLDTTTDGVPLGGMLDRDILAEMLRRAGASRGLIRAHMPDIVTHAQRVYARSCPDLRRRVCPG